MGYVISRWTPVYFVKMRVLPVINYQWHFWLSSRRGSTEKIDALSPSLWLFFSSPRDRSLSQSPKLKFPYTEWSEIGRVETNSLWANTQTDKIYGEDFFAHSFAESRLTEVLLNKLWHDWLPLEECFFFVRPWENSKTFYVRVNSAEEMPTCF